MGIKSVKHPDHHPIKPIPQFFPQVTKAVFELDDLAFRGLAHCFIQAIPTFRNHIFQHKGLLHICAVFNDLLLGVCQFKALFLQPVKGAIQGFTKLGGIIHHAIIVDFTAPAHTHSIVGKGSHHGFNGFGVGHVSGKLGGSTQHDFIPINPLALNICGGFL